MNDLHQLITRYLSGVASEHEVDQLEAQLKTSSEAQDAYLEEVALDCLLQQQILHRKINVADTSGSVNRFIEIDKKRTAAMSMWQIAIAICLLAILTFGVISWSESRQTISATPSLGEVSFQSRTSNASLFKACLAGDLQSVEIEILSGVNLNSKNADGLTPLHLAVLYGHHRVVSALLERQCSPHLTDRAGNTALHMASFLGRWVMVEELIEAGSDPLVRNHDGFNSDDLVALNWNPNLQRYYEHLELIFGFELDYEEIKASRPRIRATISRRIAKSRTLNEPDGSSAMFSLTARILGEQIARTAPQTTTESLSRSGLATAAVTGNLLGATIGRVLPLETSTSPPTVSLIQAAQTGNIAAVSQHIRAGSDLNVRSDFDGCTPVILAAAFGKTDVVRELIAAGADLTATNNQNHTALHAAAFFCRPDIVTLLVEVGIDTEVLNHNQETALDMVRAPLSEEVRYIYRYIFGMLKLPLDMQVIANQRMIIAEQLAAFKLGEPETLTPNDPKSISR